MNAHDEKLEAKIASGDLEATNGHEAPSTNGSSVVDYSEADVSLSRHNHPVGRQTTELNW